MKNNKPMIATVLGGLSVLLVAVGSTFSPVESTAAQTEATKINLCEGCSVVIDLGDSQIVVRNGVEDEPTKTATTEPTGTDTPVTDTSTATETSTDVNTDTPEPSVTPSPTDTDTPTATDTDTPTPTYTATATDTPTPTETDVPTNTATRTPSGTVTPFVSAPLCAEHFNHTYHDLWNEEQGCHYDHEHGTSPFTSQVAAAFPNFDLKQLLGGVEIGHSNPSSPMENTHKHGGMKWQVYFKDVCVTGFEGGTVGTTAAAIQYHAFGRSDIELEARIHSTAFMLKQCKSGVADPGYVFGISFQDYGQRITPYQGQLIPYPNNPQPAYDTPRGPYISVDNTTNRNVNGGSNGTQNNNHKWTSKPTGSGTRPEFSRYFRLLFNVRDGYQLFDMSDLVHPFHWLYLCGGEIYNPVGCRYNNSATSVTEIMGDVPAALDNIAGFDSDPRVGRITADFFVTKFGLLSPLCATAGGECFPVKLVSAFVGRYSSDLCVEKCSNNTPLNSPERDIYFCNGAVCSETTPGAVPSGWIGSEN
jgi:hypothetical protein